MSYACFTTCTPMVRVPSVAYTPIAAALDAGALGIMTPMVESRAQAELLVAATRYPPAGRRGAAFGVAHDDFEGGSVADKVVAANARTLVIAMIETEAGVAEIDAIAATPGIDVLWLGHFDLTNSLGIPGQFEHPRYLDCVRRILDAAGRHGQAAGMMAADEDWARRYLGMGFRMNAWGLDHHVFQMALSSGTTAMRGMVA